MTPHRSGQNDICDALGGVTIPQGYPLRIRLSRGCFSRSPLQNVFDRGAKLSQIASYQLIRSQSHRDGPLGVLSCRETRDAKEGRLFLDAARVRDHQGCATLQGDELEIGERIQESQARRK
jgi:hypothetical protein